MMKASGMIVPGAFCIHRQNNAAVLEFQYINLIDGKDTAMDAKEYYRKAAKNEYSWDEKEGMTFFGRR